MGTNIIRPAIWEHVCDRCQKRQTTEGSQPEHWQAISFYFNKAEYRATNRLLCPTCTDRTFAFASGELYPPDQTPTQEITPLSPEGKALVAGLEAGASLVWDGVDMGELAAMGLSKAELAAFGDACARGEKPPSPDPVSVQDVFEAIDKARPTFVDETCPSCDGQGSIASVEGPLSQCPKCDGLGHVPVEAP